MHSIALFCPLFLVVIPALAAPPDSKSTTSLSSTSDAVSSTSGAVSSTNGAVSSTSAPSSSSLSTDLSSSTSPAASSTSAPSSSSIALTSSDPAPSNSSINVGSILGGPYPSASAGAATGDPSLASSFAKLASEFGEFENIVAKGLKSLEALESSVYAADIAVLIATNEQLAYKLSQAQTALAASKALALKNAKQAQSDIALGKQVCTLVQEQLDKWAEIGKDASVSYIQASSIAQGLVFYIRYPISLFTEASADLGCPAKGGKVCTKVQEVIVVLKSSLKSITGVASTSSDNQQGLRQRAAAVQSVVKNAEKSIEALQDALMC